MFKIVACRKMFRISFIFYFSGGKFCQSNIACVRDMLPSHRLRLPFGSYSQPHLPLNFCFCLQNCSIVVLANASLLPFSTATTDHLPLSPSTSNRLWTNCGLVFFLDRNYQSTFVFARIILSIAYRVTFVFVQRWYDSIILILSFISGTD